MLAAWAMMTLYLSVGNSPHHVTCGDVIHTSLLLSAHNAAALSLTSLAASHHVATFRPLHYDALLTSRRVCVVLAGVWTLSALLGHVQFAMAAVSQRQADSYCEAASNHMQTALVVSTLLAGACLLAGALVYTSVVVYLRPVDERSSSPLRRSTTSLRPSSSTCVPSTRSSSSRTRRRPRDIGRLAA